MSFNIQGMTANQFNSANDFFINGFNSDKLTEKSSGIEYPMVKGCLTEWYFDGIRMAYSDLVYQEPIDLKWDYDISIELITFQINLEGSVFIVNGGSTFPVLGHHQHNLFYSNGSQADAGYLKPERLKSSVFFIQFTKEAFLRITADANELLSKFNDNVLEKKSTLLSLSNLPVNPGMRKMIKEIIACPFEGVMKKMYLLSKSIEFLVLQAESCNYDQLNPKKCLRTNYDKDCILFAREYILNHLENPPGLSQLAKIAGVNEYKLKRGFKETFGNTVFGYLAEARLDFAKENLISNNKSLAEIAMELGYSSPQHFSKAFKNKFGLSPREFKGSN
jgi:AraC family transcriptional regulator, transcriptional activator of the genes for pyochelin and ferripyochelin receptors